MASTDDRWYLCKCNVVSGLFAGACVWGVDEYMTNVHLEMSHWRQNVLGLFEVASVRKRWAQGPLSQPATVPKLTNVVLGYIP